MDSIESHIWHPYSSVTTSSPLFYVESAQGVMIKIKDESESSTDKTKEIIDGMSSWWAAIHGYNHPQLNRAATEQLNKMSHIMFGGFTHAPAQELAKLLLKILPSNLDKGGDPSNELTKIFYADSGSVSVEVAMKMAIQYCKAKFGEHTQKVKFGTIRSGYHGDTWNAMSVCDPVTGMHGLFKGTLPINFFIDAPKEDQRFSLKESSNNSSQNTNYNALEPQDPIDKNTDYQDLEELFNKEAHQMAAFIIEPIVQGAGGMRFYSPVLLVKLRELCNKYDVLLIYDEIATGFGRTGKMFATHHTADVEQNNGAYTLPDIITIGKGLTGGYLTLAATICSTKIADTICNNYPGVFMHGPTFMANPLACAIACESIKLLLNDYNNLNRIKEIESILKRELAPATVIPSVADVRVMGAIGVIEMKESVELSRIQPMLVEHGVWLRPFGKLVYTMPPYIISDEQLTQLCKMIITVLQDYK